MRPAQTISEEQKESLKKLLKSVKAKADYQRVLCIWLRATLGLFSYVVAKAIGWNTGTVRRIQAQYLKEGEPALLGKGRGGRKRQNLSIEKEELFLSSFFEQAKVGGVLVVSEIKRAYEKIVGRSVPKSTIYRMLARHGWRKIAPRPQHPKSDPLEQEAFKKNFRKLSRKKSGGNLQANKFG